MRMEGLEPSRGHPRQILSLVRLPFRHIRLKWRAITGEKGYSSICIYKIQALFCKIRQGAREKALPYFNITVQRKISISYFSGYQNSQKSRNNPLVFQHV